MVSVKKYYSFDTKFGELIGELVQQNKKFIQLGVVIPEFGRYLFCRLKTEVKEVKS